MQGCEHSKVPYVHPKETYISQVLLVDVDGWMWMGG